MSLPQHTIENGDSVQQRISGFKRKRTAQDSVEEDIAWTAVRCQRLLRTITSRISSLRRLLETDATFQTSSSGAYSEVRKHPPRKTEHWSSVDPAWVPNGKPKGQGRTYAAKPKPVVRKVLKARDPNLVFPSPFVKRIGTAGISKDESSPIRKEVQPEKKTRRSRQLPIKPQSARQQAENGLVSAVSSLLNFTKAVAQVRKGSRSLLSTCLRQVPGYIELIMDDNENHANQEDVVAEVFTYLEDFGTRDGWPGLKEVVRRQGIHLVAKAISDNVLSENSIRTMVDICSSQGALSEGHDLLQAWLGRNDAASNDSLERLDSFSSHHRCTVLKYRTINELCKSQSSLLVRYGSSTNFWKDMLSSLTGDACLEATRCLVTCLSTFGGLDYEGELKAGIKSHMRDLALKVTVMATASILPKARSSGGMGLFEALQAVTAHICLTRTSNSQKRRRRRVHLSEFEILFMLGSQLLLGLDTKQQTACGVLSLDIMTEALDISNPPDSPRWQSEWRMYQEDFAAEITKGIVTLEKYIGTTITGPLLDGALHAIESGSPVASLLKQVALETSNVLRQNNDDQLDFDLEDYMKRLNQPREPASSMQTPHRGNQNGRFRWEEGLCEWVTATPFLARAPSEGQADSGSEVDKDGDELAPSPECSPDVLALSPPLERRRVQVKSPLWGRKVTKGVVVLPAQKPRSARHSESCHIGYESGDELSF
ncbi:hypothetical protein M409DRAFT_27780 [Zasmidium cellare ATCC 36951]|uniref:Uncharacterized protein n=1 Tax=Zasmidium cellare ATCC 36951 TaxID=1080233 RepID=A0A6A6C469_ZASCE|nr:uncharacterized protein M409DRAFT_27780 [Zasmidium cellare ATCC 36951]KAF2161723.1 hypothetical protein M409DRAFT_27780 [Zasmidium cellare ATCC 36951]